MFSTDMNKSLVQLLKPPLIAVAVCAVLLQMIQPTYALSLFHGFLLFPILWYSWHLNRGMNGSLKLSVMVSLAIYVLGIAVIWNGLYVLFGDFSATRDVAGAGWVAEWPRLGQLLGGLLWAVLTAPAAAIVAWISGTLAERL
jgi:hypothetical protein